MPKTQLPDEDADKGNAAVPELDDDQLTVPDRTSSASPNERVAPGEQGKDELMQDEEDTDGNV